MEKKTSLKSSINFFLIEFVMVFLGVLLAFWVNDFGERLRDRGHAESILRNITADIQDDSAKIRVAIAAVEAQYEMLQSLTTHIRYGNYDSATLFIKSCYTSYNAFEPNTSSYQSMIYGGDLKLIEDYEVIKLTKEIDHANEQLGRVHNLYFRAVEDIRNTFICKEDMDAFNLNGFHNRREFWNRVNFLQENYLRNYVRILEVSQSKYHEFLRVAVPEQ